MAKINYVDSAQFRVLENLKETSMDLFLVHSGKEYCYPSHLWDKPREEYIIHFVLEGKGIYTAGGHTYALSPGQMFLIYPGEPISYCADYEHPWRYAWIGFNGIQAGQIVKACGFSHKKLILPSVPADTVLKYVDGILDARHLTPPNDLRRKAYLLAFLAELMDFATKRTNASNNYSSKVYVEHAIEYIKNSFQREIHVSDIADYIGISRTHLNNSFQKELGISTQKFLIDYRMHKAANLLMSSPLSVNEVASAVGYEDALAFSKAFKKKFEVSPKNYRSHVEEMNVTLR